MINWHQCNLYCDVNRCDNDGGDCDAVLPMVCPTCLVENAFMRLGDRKCDDDLNNIICCYDKGDCESLTSCPTCQSFLEVHCSHLGIYISQKSFFQGDLHSSKSFF